MDTAATPVLDQQRLSIERTRLAFARTLMGEIRTSTALITFGFALYKFFQVEHPVGKSYALGPREFGILMILIGIATLTFGTGEYVRGIRFLRTQVPDLPRSNIVYVAILVALLGVVGLIAAGLRR